MILEDEMVFLAQRALAYKTEVGRKLFIFKTPHGSALPARIGFQRYSADVLLLRCTLLKARIAGAKNGPEYTIARRGIAAPSRPQAETIANAARLLS
jgi:hypothetical protein